MRSSAYYYLLVFFLIYSSSVLAQSGIIKGRVFNSINNDPIPFANVVVDGTTKGSTTDLEGFYMIEGLESALYNISVEYIGFKPRSFTEVQVTNSKPAFLDIGLEERKEELSEVVVSASPFRKTEESPVSLRTIGTAEIQRNPGGNRDISKVVQVLPGVTTTVSFRNDLLIRGGAPNENRFFLDDIEVPTINHFTTQGASGGPVGLINVDFIREVDFYSAAFPANRGNAVSSVFNFKFRDGRTDRLGFTATVGSSDVGLTLEGPIGEKATFLLSSRQSYLQFLFDVLELPFLPTYNDFQGKLKIRLDKKNELSFIGLGAIDRFTLNLDANETEEQRYQLGNIPENSQWNYTTGVSYKHYYDKGFTTVVLSRNMLNNEAEKFENNDSNQELLLEYKSQEIENKFRVEHTLRTGPYKFSFGGNYEFVKFNNRTFNIISVPGGQQEIDFFSDINFHKYGLFLQVSRDWLEEKITASVGFRADGSSYSSEMSNLLEQFSPRASLAIQVAPRWTINLNGGLYYQLPPFTVMGYQENGTLVNKENGLRYIENYQFVAGVEYNLGANSKVTLEGYYKNYNNYPFTLRDSISLANLGGDFGVLGNEPVVSIGDGRAYGLEFFYQQRLFKGFYGLVSYTLGVSEFQDKNGVATPSSWDSRHILNLTGGKRFGKNWELGLNFRFQSSLPFTPYDLERSSQIANWNILNDGIRDYRRLNQNRFQSAHALDVRVDKKWFFNKWSFNFYFDIENIYGATVTEQVLVLDRNENGEAQINPQNPDAYLLKTLDIQNGTVLPSIGIVISY